MNVSLWDVKNVFLAVLANRMSREQADRWAHSVLVASESNSLVFIPSADQETIWSGVMYLNGIDSMDSPGVYLHNEEDIRNAMTNIFGD